MATAESALQRKRQLRQRLIDAQAALDRVLDRVGPEGWTRPSPNEGWAVRDLLAHLSSAERGFLSVIRRLAAGEGGVPDDFDRDRWNESQLRRSAETSVQEMRERLSKAHLEMLDLLDHVEEPALDYRGLLSSGERGTVEDAFRLVAHHKRAHTASFEASLA